MQALLDKLFANQALAQAESHRFFSEVIKGNVSNEQLAAALIALKLRGETVDEIAGAAKAALENANPFSTPDYPLRILSAQVAMGIIPSTFLPQVRLLPPQWAIKLPNTATVAYQVKPAQAMY